MSLDIFNKTYDTIYDCIMNATQYDLQGVGEKYVTASSVSEEPLQTYLKRRHNPIKEGVDESTLGSLMHKGLEEVFRNADMNAVRIETEKRIVLKDFYKGYDLSGAFDLLIERDDYIALVDWKITKKRTVERFVGESPLTNSYNIQGNVLSYIYRKLFTPDKPVYSFIGFWLKDGSKISGNPIFNLSQIKHIDDFELENYIKNAIETYDHYDANEILPPECNDKFFISVKKKVIPSKCMYYCSVRKHCPYFNKGRYSEYQDFI